MKNVNIKFIAFSSAGSTPFDNTPISVYLPKYKQEQVKNVIAKRKVNLIPDNMNSNDSGVESSVDDSNDVAAAPTAGALVELKIPRFEFTLPSELESPVFTVPLLTPIVRPNIRHSLKMRYRYGYKSLIAHKIHPFSSPERNRQKLCLAASNCDTEMVRHLLEIGTDPNCADEHKRSPLHLAACRGHFPVVQQLLIAGANPNIVDSLGNTPLHLSVISASSIDFFFVISILLKSGANPNALDRNGKRPQELVQSKMRLLQERNRDCQEIELLLRVLRYFDTLKYDENHIPDLEQRLQSLTTEDRISQTDAESLLANIERLSITK